MEHLNRNVQMRVQIQKPFEFCNSHNVLHTAAASFSEQVERMVGSNAVDMVLYVSLKMLQQRGCYVHVRRCIFPG